MTAREEAVLRYGHAFLGPGWREALGAWAERLAGARFRVRTLAWGRRRVRRSRPLTLLGPMPGEGRRPASWPGW